ncbi:MAG: protein CapI [Rhodospirillales bacterium RIFCSPLOWO2_12_FULL_58_28]|nr:MAG: protein CapI [Rhodospirillales bacterium RIFCSPLOWO2_02_FULL_58_16]OHC77625.1 MAG: protein CapI [Rhodospirillales bacterium RIFCSPLOWO2_12_FULL_58_28]
MTVLVTGAAGFIGFHVCQALVKRGERVVGVDNLNDYYDVSLKKARLAVLKDEDGFSFERLDIAERADVDSLIKNHGDIDRIVHLAAQAGVRYSLIDPYAYTRANIEGHLVLLEACRRLKPFHHMVYASSSSVYGSNEKMPFAVDDRTDSPLSLYGATKKAMEVMSHAYAHLFELPQTGLRFFTVYGPWGRPDMAAFIFVRKILAGEPIPVFNNGDMKRDFTYIDDIVDGVLRCLDHPPSIGKKGDGPPCRLYNIGNSRSENLMDFIALIERELGKKAGIAFKPMQPGDVKETYSDIADARRDFGYMPKTTIEEGIPRFVRWYRNYYENY